MIRENLNTVQEKIRQACERAGRPADDVTLIAVSKTKPVDMIMEAYEAGIRDFGENKVQELMDKIPRLPSDIRWHIVDSLRLAEEISREAVKQQTTVKILIEVNAAGEESKFGVSPEETEALVRAAAALPGIEVCGLMTIAPLTENPEDNRIFFKTLKKLSVDMEGKNIDNVHMVCLSMGMTGDYETACEEGATFVRVGTGIFGERSWQI